MGTRPFWWRQFSNKWSREKRHPLVVTEAKTAMRTCWQILAYLARTLAFSAMERGDGQPSPIFSTHLHLAKSQPSFLYWAHRFARPSRPKNATKSQFLHSSFCRNWTKLNCFYLVLWSLHLFHLDQLCLHPPTQKKNWWNLKVDVLLKWYKNFLLHYLRLHSPWCQQRCPSPWGLGRKACRYLTSGRVSRGIRWPLPHCWPWRHHRRKGCRGSCGGSPHCSPHWSSGGAFPWYLTREERGYPCVYTNIHVRITPWCIMME